MIDKDSKYPNNAFNSVIFKSVADKFKDFDKLESKKIEIKGRLKEYRSIPEIILNDPAQLKIVEEK